MGVALSNAAFALSDTKGHGARVSRADLENRVYSCDSDGDETHLTPAGERM